MSSQLQRRSNSCRWYSSKKVFPTVAWTLLASGARSHRGKPPVVGGIPLQPGLDSGPATVHRERGAGYERGRRGAEEGDRERNLARLPTAGEGRLRGDLSKPLCVAPKWNLIPDPETGGDGVDPDPLIGPLDRERAHKSGHPGLRGAIGGGAGHRDQPRKRRDRDDAAAVRHRPRAGAAGVEDAGEVGGDDPVPLSQVELGR